MSDKKNKLNDSTSTIAVECTCDSGHKYWWRLSDGNATECPDCREKHGTLMTKRSQLIDDNLLDGQNLYARLSDLLMKATEPIPLKERGLFEAFFDLDPNALERAKCQDAREKADYLLDSMDKVLALVRKQAETQGVVLKQELEAPTTVEREKLRRRRLEAAAEHVEFKRETLRLQEAKKQQALLEPTKPAVSPTKRVINEYREKFAVKADAEQDVITDCRRRVADIFMADIDDHEKALRIHAVLRTYRLGSEALPKVVRELLDRVDQESSR